MRTLAAVCCLAASLALRAGAAPEQARRAAEFIDSIGVCTHWGYPDTPYGGAYEAVKACLLELGIRHVRDGFNPRIADLGRSGVKTTLLVEPTNGSPAEIVDKIKTLLAEVPGCIDAVEGPNEADLFWVKNHRAYQGKPFPEGVLLFQRELYAALRADPATRALTVIGPSLGVTYDPGAGKPNPFAPGSLADACDWGCFHPYPFGGNPFSVPFPYAGLQKYYWQGSFPSVNLDEFPQAFKTYAPPFAPRPMCATETGYSTEQPGGTSEAVHAKYLPRLFAEYFRLGVKRTFSYELIDEFPKPADHEANFGLIRHDLSPKPAFAALKNLLAVLADPDAPAGFQPGKLDWFLSVFPAPGFERTNFVHHLLLQRANGDFYLLIWHEIADEDASASPRRRFSPPGLRARLDFPSHWKAQVLYPNESRSTAVTPLNVYLELTATDQLALVRLTADAPPAVGH